MPAYVETAMIAERPSWWGEATIDHAPNAAEAIKAAGLDWEVLQRPLYLNTDDEYFDEVPGYRANIRSSDNSLLAVVGKNYKPIQNAEWFGFMDVLLGEGVKFETAGSLFGGKQVWMLARMPEHVTIAGDEIRQYLLATNGHDGLRSGKMMAVDTRVVCWNTLSLALKEAKRTWSIRHSQQLSGREDEVREHLLLASEYFKGYKKEAEKLLKMKFAEKKYTELVDFLLPLPEEATQRVLNNIESRRSLLWQEIKSEDLENIRKTGWGAVQAVAALVAHEPPGRKTATWGERRFSNIMIDGDKLVKKALEFVYG